MTLRLHATSRSKRDFWTCHDYIAQRSPEGAARWVIAYEAATKSLLENPNRALAPESVRHDVEIRQRHFNTPHGLAYRILFVQHEVVIYIVHVRGPGQDLMQPDEIELPEELSE